MSTIIALVSWPPCSKENRALIYNFGGGKRNGEPRSGETDPEETGKPESLISFVTDRLGHDRRYAIDSTFAHRELNWKPRHSRGRDSAKRSSGTATINRGGRSYSSAREGISYRLSAESRSIVACLLRSILVNTNILAFASSFEGCAPHYTRPLRNDFGRPCLSRRERGETAVFRWAVAL